MAKNIDPKNLSVDYKKLMRMTIQDRVGFIQSGGASYLESLTPTQLAQLFPKYYQRQLPDIGKIVSGGTAGIGAPSAAPTAPSGVSGTKPSTSQQQQTKPQQGKPQQSSTARENSFFSYIQGLAGKPTQQQTTQQNIPDGLNPLAVDRQNAAKQLSREDKIHMYALSIAEKGDKNPRRNAELIESVYNRYMAQRKPSIQSTMLRNYYDPLRPEADPKGWARYQAAKKRLQSDPEYFNKLDAIHNEVLSGSNYTNYGTHNASLGVAASARRTQTITHTSGEETYSRKDIIAFAGEHGLGTVRKEKAWFESIKRRMDEYYANQANNPNVKPPSRVSDATIVQKPEQERPSQAGTATGLRPDSSSVGQEQGPKAKFQSESIEKRSAMMKQSTQDALGRFRLLSPNDSISSTYRSPSHPIESRKRIPGAHSRGEAIDVSTRGKSAEQLQATVQSLKRAGFNYILLEGNPPHIHAEVRPNQTGFRVQNLGAGHPTLSLEAAKEAANKVDLGAHGLATEMPADKVDANKAVQLPKDYASWNPKLREEIEKLSPSQQDEFFKNIESLSKREGFDINSEFEKYDKQRQQTEVSTQEAAKVTATQISAAPPGQLPANFDPNDPIGSLERVRNPQNPKLAGRVDPEGNRHEPEFFSDMENRKGSPFNYALSEQGQKEFGQIHSNLVTIQTNSGKKIRVNAAVADDAKAMIDEIEARGYKIDVVGGYRVQGNVNAPGKPSMHNFGTAIDINPGQNPNKPKVPGMTDMPENMKYVAMKYGFAQLGYDRMHFERVSPALRKVYIQRLIQQGWVKPDDPLVQKRIQQGVITQEEVSKIKITPIMQQPPPEQRSVDPTQVITPSPTVTGSAVPQPVTPAAPAPGPAAPQQTTPVATSIPQATPVETPVPQQAAPATPPAPTATPVEEAPPRSEDQIKENAYGGQEQTTENIGFFDTNTGKTLGTAQRGEVVALNQSGVAQIKPEQRIGEIPELRSDIPQSNYQQSEPNEPMQQQNYAQMTQTQPNPAAGPQQIFNNSIESSKPSNFYENESYGRAMEQYNFATTKRKYGFDSGFNTLFG